MLTNKLEEKMAEPEEASEEEEAAEVEAAEEVPQVVAEVVLDKTTKTGLP